MAKKKADSRPEPGELTYEQAIEELEAISDRIERGEVGLEESLAEYRRGMALAKRCSDILAVAEQEIKNVKAGDSGAASDSADD